MAIWDAITNVARMFHGDMMGAVNFGLDIYHNWNDRKRAREQQDKQWEEYAKEMDREAQWRNEDMALAQKWRDEDIERNSLKSRMGEMKEMGLHPQLAVGSPGGDHATSPRSTGSGGRVPRPVQATGGTGTPPQMAGLDAMSSLMLAEKQAQLMDAETKLKLKEAGAFDIREKTAIALMNAQISSSEANDRLTDEQRRMVHAQADRWIRDNKIIFDGAKWVLGETDTWDDLVVDIVRSGLSRNTAESLLGFLRNARSELERNTVVGRVRSAIEAKREKARLLSTRRSGGRGAGRGSY